MRTLADEILAELPIMLDALPLGPIARDVADYIAADVPNVRRAMEQLEAEGRAKIVRRGRALHLVPADYPGRICPVCRAEYTRPRKSRRVTCSRSCGVALSWRSPEAYQRRVEGIKAERQTDKAISRLAAHNRRRWAKPDEHSRLSAQNRAQWRDPVARVKRSVSIAKVHGSPERRERQRQAIQARWNDKDGRDKLEAGIRQSKRTPEARAKFSELLRARWQDPEWREKMLAAIGPARCKAAEAVRGRKQSPEHVAKRTGAKFSEAAE